MNVDNSGNTGVYDLIYSHYVRGLILHHREPKILHPALRTSFRKDGKVKHRTIANISSCSDEEIQAVKLGLKYKGNLAELASLDKSMKLQQGLRVGAVGFCCASNKQLHIVDALGAGRQAELALWQIMARPSSNARACPPCAWPALPQFVTCLTWIVSMKTTSTPTSIGCTKTRARSKTDCFGLRTKTARRRYSSMT